MSEEIIIVEEDTMVTNTAVSPTNTSRRLILAGIGAAVVVHSEMKAVVDKLIEQGEAVVQDGRRTLSTQHRPLRRRWQRPVDTVLARLNIPTKSDIDHLNSQVNALLEKIARLQEQEHHTLSRSPELPVDTPTSSE